MLSLRVDPWAAEYEGAIQWQEDQQEAPAHADTAVEGVGWGAVAPARDGRLPPFHFVDGVRRVDVRVLADAEGGPAYGLFGSLAVGSAHCEEGRASFGPRRVERFLVLGGGLSGDEVRVAAGSQELVYEPQSTQDNTPGGPLLKLQELMRKQEEGLGRELAQADEAIVVMDGPLRFESARAPAIGFVKTLYRQYLAPAEAALLPELLPGQRTPIFGLTEGRLERYSWYQRLAEPRAIEHGLAGVVRLEAPAAMGLDRVRLLADLMASQLPAFASSARHDPRAPQNLFPIGALERDLRHRLGDPLWVRRAIETSLYHRARQAEEVPVWT